MRTVSLVIAATAALIAAVGGGFIAGRSQHQPAEGASLAVLTSAVAQTNGATIYYKTAGTDYQEYTDPISASQIETYTVMHGRDGAPEQGIVAVRRPDQRRAWGVTGDAG